MPFTTATAAAACEPGNNARYSAITVFFCVDSIVRMFSKARGRILFLLVYNTVPRVDIFWVRKVIIMRQSACRKFNAKLFSCVHIKSFLIVFITTSLLIFLF